MKVNINGVQLKESWSLLVGDVQVTQKSTSFPYDDPKGMAFSLDADMKSKCIRNAKLYHRKRVRIQVKQGRRRVCVAKGRVENVSEPKGYLHCVGRCTGT